MPSIYAPGPKGRMRIYHSLWCWRHIRLPLWMGVIEMQDTKAVTIPSPYYKNVCGGQEWPTRWDNLLEPAHVASNLTLASLRPLYAPLWLLLPMISCMLTSQAMRPCWSQTNHLELPMSWFSKTTSWNMCWHTWPSIKQQKPLLMFCTKVTSISLGPQPGSWVIEVLASLVVWFRKCGRSLASNDCGPCLPPTNQWLGREITPNNYMHDQEAGRI